jgi:HK97 gp10 family phage protein
MAGVTGFNLLPQLIDLIHNTVEDTVVQVCLQIQQNAKALAPVDTSFLQSSIYTSTKDGDTYGAGFGDPPGDATTLEDIGPPPDSGTGYVAVAASYGIYQEFGTRKMGAQPYLIPALEMEKAAFEGGAYLTQAIGGMSTP